MYNCFVHSVATNLYTLLHNTISYYAFDLCYFLRSAPMRGPMIFVQLTEYNMVLF